VTSAERYADLEFLEVEVADRVATIRLNLPDTLNAMDDAAHKELSTILRTVASDESVNAAVVTGAGRAFSVGGDLSLVENMNRDPSSLLGVMRDARELVQAHIDFEKPIVAAINGVAMGAGLAFALLCDFIIIERGARVADGHVRAALTAGDGGALIWPLAVGLVQAKKYLMTGDWLSADEAERLGLVTEVVDSGTSVERAHAIARRLADGPQVAIRTTKMALNQWLRLGQLGSFDYSLALEMISAVHADVPRALQGLRTNRVGAIAAEESDDGGA